MKLDITKGRGRNIYIHLYDFFNLGFLNTENTWLAGGALRSAIYSTMGDAEEVVADYDMFFRDALSSAKVEVELESLGAETIFKCPEGKLTTMKYNGMKIQLITEFFYESMQQLIDTFDINACRYATDGKILLTYHSVIRDTLKKKITLYQIHFPVATMKRIAKYIQKGYTLTSNASIGFVEHIHFLGTNHLPVNTRVYID